MDAKEKVKSDILSWFRENKADVGHALNERSFLSRYVMNYNPKEKGVVQEALNDLETEGLLEIRDGIFVLTKRGVDTIY